MNVAHKIKVFLKPAYDSGKMRFCFGDILPAINYAVNGYKMLFPTKRLHRGVSGCIVPVG